MGSRVSQIIAAAWLRLPRWSQRRIVRTLTPKFNLGVNAVIINNQGQIWLQKHRFWPQQAWGLPGGYLNAEEDPREGLIRELREEVSAEIQVSKVLEVERSPQNPQTVVIYYAAEFITPPGEIDQREIIEARYFDPTQLPEIILPFHRKIIKQYSKSHLSKE